MQRTSPEDRVLLASARKQAWRLLRDLQVDIFIACSSPQARVGTFVNDVTSRWKVPIVLVAEQIDDVDYALLSSPAGAARTAPARSMARDQAALTAAVASDVILDEAQVNSMRRALSDRLETSGQAFVHGLSRTELEVLILLRKGMTHTAIAELRGISPNTVRNHLHSIYRKLRVHRREDALAKIGLFSGDRPGIRPRSAGSASGAAWR
jgi:DNA-binding NarL/FixJ family response regulator